MLSSGAIDINLGMGEVWTGILINCCSCSTDCLESNSEIWGGLDNAHGCLLMLVRVMPITTVSAPALELELLVNSSAWHKGSESGETVGKSNAGAVGLATLAARLQAVINRPKNKMVINLFIITQSLPLNNILGWNIIPL